MAEMHPADEAYAQWLHGQLDELRHRIFRQVARSRADVGRLVLALQAIVEAPADGKRIASRALGAMKEANDDGSGAARERPVYEVLEEALLLRGWRVVATAPKGLVTSSADACCFTHPDLSGGDRCNLACAVGLQMDEDAYRAKVERETADDTARAPQ